MEYVKLLTKHLKHKTSHVMGYKIYRMTQLDIFFCEYHNIKTQCNNVKEKRNTVLREINHIGMPIRVIHSTVHHQAIVLKRWFFAVYLWEELTSINRNSFSTWGQKDGSFMFGRHATL